MTLQTEVVSIFRFYKLRILIEYPVDVPRFRLDENTITVAYRMKLTATQQTAGKNKIPINLVWITVLQE